jgi:fermentation-respiration switch protein FrsA (DUF1100 family)
MDYVYDFDYPFEEKFYKTPHKGNIHTLKFKAKDAKGLVFYLHGNAGSLRDWGWIYADFVKKDYDVFVIDYRSYGKSTGPINEANIHSDVAFIYKEVKKEYAENTIVVYGRSIGTGMAAKLAASYTPKAIVLESPYYSIKDVAKKMAPIFPLEILLKYKFNSYAYLSDATSPIYIIHGTNDKVIPFLSGEKLYQLHEDKITFYKVEGGQHNDLSNHPEFEALLDEVLN